MKLAILVTNIPDNVECSKIDEVLARVTGLTPYGYTSTYLNDNDAEAQGRTFKFTLEHCMSVEEDGCSEAEAFGNLCRRSEMLGLSWSMVVSVQEVS